MAGGAGAGAAASRGGGPGSARGGGLGPAQGAGSAAAAGGPKDLITRENLEARVGAALGSPESCGWAIAREGLAVKPEHKGSQGPNEDTAHPGTTEVKGLGLI